MIIVGCGVGGHGAALHARSQGLKTCVLSGGDVGGTCVNRGCVPSKALLAASGRVREMSDDDHLASMGISTNGVSFDREGVAKHAEQLVNKVRGGLEGSLGRLGVDLVPKFGVYKEPHVLDGGVLKVQRQDLKMLNSHDRLQRCAQLPWGSVTWRSEVATGGCRIWPSGTGRVS